MAKGVSSFVKIQTDEGQVQGLYGPSSYNRAVDALTVRSYYPDEEKAPKPGEKLQHFMATKEGKIVRAEIIEMEFVLPTSEIPDCR